MSPFTIVEGHATCWVRGDRYGLSGYDTAFIPEGSPHRFVNDSSASMSMIWVYASNEPERFFAKPGYCDERLPGLAFLLTDGWRASKRTTPTIAEQKHSTVQVHSTFKDPKNFLRSQRIAAANDETLVCLHDACQE